MSAYRENAPPPEEPKAKRRWRYTNRMHATAAAVYVVALPPIIGAVVQYFGVAQLSPVMQGLAWSAAIVSIAFVMTGAKSGIDSGVYPDRWDRPAFGGEDD